MADLEILIREATPPQVEFWGADQRFRAFVGGIGSGKTWAGSAEVWAMPSGSTGMVLAPSYPMLRDATLRTFLDLSREAGVLADFIKSENRAELVNGTTVLFRSSDDPDRLRGPNLGWFWLDEAALMPFDVWLIMIGRLREQPGRAWVTTTPKGKDWLHKLFVANGDPIYRLIRASTRTNAFLDGSFLPSLESVYDRSFAQQEIEGEFVDDAYGILIPDSWVDRMADPGICEHVESLRRKRRGGDRLIAVDLGEGVGRDRTAVGVFDRLGLLAVRDSDRAGLAAGAAWVDELRREYGVSPHNIVFDAGGRGKDFPRYLEQHDITDALPYHGGGSGGRLATNRRSACAWSLRQRLDPDRPLERAPVPDQPESLWEPLIERPGVELQPPFALPLGDRPWWRSLAEELRALRYQMSGRKVELQKKEDLVASLGRSPDLVDMLIMSRALD